VEPGQPATCGGEDVASIGAPRHQPQQGLDLCLVHPAPQTGKAAELSDLLFNDAAEPEAMREERARVLVGKQLGRSVLLLHGAQQGEWEPGIYEARG